MLYPHLWYKFNLHILPKSFGANIQHKYIFWNIYIPQLCARRANRNYPTYIHPPNCLHDVSNQNIYQTDIYSPNCWQYSIQIYISTKLYSPTLQLQLVLAWYIKYQNIYSTDIFSPNCWLHISNKKFSLLKKLKAYKKAFCGQETEPSNICMWLFLFNFNVKCMIYVVQFPSTYQTFATSTPPLLKM